MGFKLKVFVVFLTETIYAIVQLNVPIFVSKWKNHNDPHKTFISIQMHKRLKLIEIYIYSLQRTNTPTERFPNHKASHSRHTTSMQGVTPFQSASTLKGRLFGAGRWVKAFFDYFCFHAICSSCPSPSEDVQFRLKIKKCVFQVTRPPLNFQPDSFFIKQF